MLARRLVPVALRLTWGMMSVLVAPPLIAYSASFDCSKVKGYVERTVCSDPELSELDDALAAAFDWAKAEALDASELTREQRAWLVQRNACLEPSCIKAAYETRLEHVEQSRAVMVAASSAADRRSQPAQYCMVRGDGHNLRPCARPSNDHILNAVQVLNGNRAFCEQYLHAQYESINLSLPHSVTQTEAREYVHSLVGRGDGSGDVHPRAARIDLNNDGVPERVTWISMYSGAGRGCDVEFYVELDRAGKIKRDGISPLLKPTQCGDRFRAINYGGKAYLEKRTLATSVEGYVDVTQELIAVERRRSRSVCKFAFVWDLIGGELSTSLESDEPPELLNVFK
jgi:uncharacterized protein